MVVKTVQETMGDQVDLVVEDTEPEVVQITQVDLVIHLQQLQLKELMVV